MRPSAVGAGLWNLGNTCYANAALQCLTHTPPLSSYMLSRRHSDTCRKQACCMLCAVEAHVTRALLHPGDVIQPSEGLLMGFHRHGQEDAHEFLMFTMHAMQEACLYECAQLDRPSEDPNLIRQIFGGTWRSQIECLHCHGVSDTLDPYLDIALDIQGARSVSQALDLLVKPDKLDGDNSYHCGVCLKKVPASKTLTLHTSSKVLILVLKWFSDFTGMKMEKEVHYPEHLDMRPYLSQQDAGPLAYELYAVLVHAGWTCHSGHYFCYIKAADGQWFKIDDTQVIACDVSSALSQRAYVLFYIQKNELGRDAGSAFLSGEPRCRRTEHRVMGSTRWGPARHSHSMGEGSGRPTTLEEWRLFQKQFRPKPEFNLRKIECVLPANVAVIHQGTYRGGMPRCRSAQESSLHGHPARGVLPQGTKDTGQVPCPRGRARANKRKKKKRRRRRRRRRSRGLWTPSSDAAAADMHVPGGEHRIDD
ncbi:ubiquitin carboxyl-terminal hydrolase 17-like protein 6 [Saccopteryx leptura]|uniref:ubiquitin carboxyl-terminal hydrolase 17-like protein 6 n=1 Tax=Saccopteryx leptura TaxID=249018 RepID=UPI00339CFB7B